MTDQHDPVDTAGPRQTGRLPKQARASAPDEWSVLGRGPADDPEAVENRTECFFERARPLYYLSSLGFLVCLTRVSHHLSFFSTSLSSVYFLFFSDQM